MKSYLSYLFSLAFFFLASCTESYQLPNLGNQTTIVITGLITNEPGPYYVTVWENVSNISTGESIRRGINDARVIITDSKGNVDELCSFYSVPLESEVLEDWPFYREYYRIPDGKGYYIKFITSSKNDTREGKYFTTSTKGQPGQTYTLKVEYAGREYIATDYMCFGTVIDSISVEPIGRFINDKPDGSDGFLVPCIYFAEPQDETNYYLFKYFSFWQTDGKIYVEHINNMSLMKMSDDWLISVVSDRFMPPYVNKYKISDGDSERKYYSGTDMGFYHSGCGWVYGGAVDMYCITEAVYRYYNELSRQYYQDGGAFSPSPASPPTNISGGAQGCFSAASVSQYVLDLRNNQ